MKPVIYSCDDVRCDEHTIADLARHDFTSGGDGEERCSEKQAREALHAWCASDQVDMLIEVVGGMPEAISQYRAAWTEVYADEQEILRDQAYEQEQYDQDRFGGES